MTIKKQIINPCKNSRSFSSQVIFLACVCRKNDNSDPFREQLVQQKLQAMADNLMAGYKAKYPENPGGVALKVIYKSNSWFVTSGMGQGVTGDLRFRAANNSRYGRSAQKKQELGFWVQLRSDHWRKELK